MTEPVETVFSLLVAMAGLAGFALALALVEQIVLETNLANVSRGSRVYESGHVSAPYMQVSLPWLKMFVCPPV